MRNDVRELRKIKKIATKGYSVSLVVENNGPGPFGGRMTLSWVGISDIYITVHNSSKIAALKKQYK